ncbi:MAG: hypothetical protein KF884_01355 [Fimbriimonadaceae bacterium]|nr:hypothetical protein [Fimbriimonadaceae bacterium]QYK58742.1 MAG: hypothetical protein KF884_01355 [Fimbriimonadaceae bacterium]
MMGELLLTLLQAIDWQLDYRIGPTTTQVTEWVYENSNFTSEPMTISVTFSYALTKRIWGAEDESPPWTSPFKPLTNTYDTVNYFQYPVQLGSMRKRTYNVTFSRNRGEEQWSGGEPPNLSVAKRNRCWEGPYFVWYEDTVLP